MSQRLSSTLPYLIDSKNLHLRPIPHGSFLMGASLEELWQHGVPIRYARREYPQRKISIAKPFAVAKYPVTREEFEEYVIETGNEPAHWCEVFRNGKWEFDASLNWQNPGFPQEKTHPVVAVSWHDAHGYLSWLSKKNGKHYRLLSDAEYEYATRAGTKTPWFWGLEESSQAEYAKGADLSSLEASDTFSLSQTYGAPIMPAVCHSGYIYTAPVGMFKPNAFGLHDMSGNVWEWVADCFDENFLPSDQSAATWPNCELRTIRGGSWLMEPAFLRSAARQRDYAWHNDRDIGFRVARDLAPDEEEILNRLHTKEI